MKKKIGITKAANKVFSDTSEKRKKVTGPQAAWKKEQAEIKRAKEVRQRIAFQEFCEKYGIPKPVPEFQFAKKQGRKWRIDYYFERECIVDGYPKTVKIALEVEGGVYTGGRHVTPEGFLKDMEKYNALAEYGITLYRITPGQLFQFDVVTKLKKLLHPDQYPEFKV